MQIESFILKRNKKRDPNTDQLSFARLERVKQGEDSQVPSILLDVCTKSCHMFL